MSNIHISRPDAAMQSASSGDTRPTVIQAVRQSIFQLAQLVVIVVGFSIGGCLLFLVAWFNVRNEAILLVRLAQWLNMPVNWPPQTWQIIGAGLAFLEVALICLFIKSIVTMVQKAKVRKATKEQRDRIIDGEKTE